MPAPDPRSATAREHLDRAFAEAESARIDAAIAATPLQRLEWLEEAIELAWRGGAVRSLVPPAGSRQTSQGGGPEGEGRSLDEPGEPLTKVAGQRRTDRFDWEDVDRLQRTLMELGGAALVPRGVHRFSTFEEADEWMDRMMARARGHRPSRTSRASATR